MKQAEDSCTGIREKVDARIGQAFANRASEQVNEAARYVMSGGGHRWRAIIAVLSGRMFPASSPRAVLQLAAAIELFHAASLVLDDLPSMDNASLRRGQPCVHTCHPSWVVDMLPSYLLTLGYEMLLTLPQVDAQQCNLVARRASEIAQKMTRGQELDIDPETSDFQALHDCHRLKTGLLYGFAASAPAALAEAPGKTVSGLQQFGLLLGLLYQLDDDCTDFRSDPVLTGKDGGDGPPAALDSLPREAISQLAEDLHRDAERQLSLLPVDTSSLSNLLPALTVRR